MKASLVARELHLHVVDRHPRRALVDNHKGSVQKRDPKDNPGFVGLPVGPVAVLSPCGSFTHRSILPRAVARRMHVGNYVSRMMYTHSSRNLKHVSSKILYTNFQSNRLPRRLYYIRTVRCASCSNSQYPPSSEQASYVGSFYSLQACNRWSFTPHGVFIRGEFVVSLYHLFDAVKCLCARLL